MRIHNSPSLVPNRLTPPRPGACDSPKGPVDSVLLGCRDFVEGSLARATPFMLGTAGGALSGGLLGSLVGHPEALAVAGSLVAGAGFHLIFQSLASID